jgi:hypothetical protein
MTVAERSTIQSVPPPGLEISGADERAKSAGAPVTAGSIVLADRHHPQPAKVEDDTE